MSVRKTCRLGEEKWRDRGSKDPLISSRTETNGCPHEGTRMRGESLLGQASELELPIWQENPSGRPFRGPMKGITSEKQRKYVYQLLL